MQIIRKTDKDPKLVSHSSWVNHYGHKHTFRMTYLPQFFWVGFVCKTCSETVLVERDLWNDWIRGPELVVLDELHPETPC